MEGFSQIDLKQEATNRERVYFGVILLLMVVAFARWFYLPRISEIKMVKVELKNFSMQIENLKRFSQLKIPETQLSERSMVIGGAKFNKVVEESTKPKQQVIADVMQSLTMYGNLHGVSLSGITLSDPLDKGGYYVVPLVVDLDGRYSGIMTYLSRIERLDRLITANNIELTVAKDNPASVHGKIVGSIYIVKSPGEVTAPPPSDGIVPAPPQAAAMPPAGGH